MATSKKLDGESDQEFIEASKRHLGLELDAHLEAKAGLPKSTLSMARTGRQPLSGFAKAKILDLRGYAWARDALMTLFGEKGRDWIAKDKERLQRQAAAALKKRDGE